MIFLNQEIESIFTVSQDMVLGYKKTCDSYLVDIRRNMTKQLLDYRLYTPLKELYNAYGKLILDVANNKYCDMKDFDTDYKQLVTAEKAFTQDIKGRVSDDIYAKICEDVDFMHKNIDKLVYVLKNFCYTGGENNK